ncbi:MAG: carboxylating nicotinate-nucleotide diphosphorylase [Actinomycetota bacterium]
MALEIARVRKLVRPLLDEDIGRGDVTTQAVLPPDLRGRARIEARSPGVLAGLDVARCCFEEVHGADFSWAPAARDGQTVVPGDVVVRLEAQLASILTAERTALNLLSKLSGVATATRDAVQAVDERPVRIADTRKTTPGLRYFEKYAVVVGGGANHRAGLDDGVLIKDNHIAAAGGVAEAVKRARAGVSHGLRIEVEVTDLSELDEALAAGADAILLDNMAVGDVQVAVGRAGGKALLEASGGINSSNVAEYAATGVDVISLGAITHSAPHIDFALEVEK